MLPIFPMPEIKAFKKTAKRLAHAEGIPHSQALDRIAVQYGYRNWPLLHRYVFAHLDVRDDRS